MQKMKEELDEARSQLLIAGMKLETDLEDEKRKAHEEIASLQQLVHGEYIFIVVFVHYCTENDERVMFRNCGGIQFIS